MHGYELWETQSGNLLDDFATAESAASRVHEWIAREGSESLESITLITVSDDGKAQAVASGRDLEAWAHAVVPATLHQSARSHRAISQTP